MNILLEIGYITIDLNWLLAFFSGVVFGLTLMILTYLYAVVKSLNRGLKSKKVQEANIDEQEIIWLIDDARKVFKNKAKQKEVGFGTHLLNVSLELANDIAKKFYPKSKYPYLELTIDETLVLLKYVSDRLDEFLDKPILKLFKRMTLRRIVSLKDVKDAYDQNLIVKTSKKFKINHIINQTMMALNIINPVYWFRKLVLNNVLSAVITKLALVVISLVGEETYKIYSKKVFNEEVSLDSGIEDLYQEIFDHFKKGEKSDEE